jgi:hypothetical protein
MMVMMILSSKHLATSSGALISHFDFENRSVQIISPLGDSADIKPQFIIIELYRIH